MPAPSRTSLPRIVAAARIVLARDGLDALTMQSVASEAGVRAPSLYKHVAGRADLLRLVIADVAAESRDLLAAAASTGSARGDLRAMAMALRAYAHRDPHGFSLMFAPSPEESALDPEVYASAAEPVLEVARRLAGPDHALDAARTVTAWASGFLRMELAGAFHLGGSVDQAYEFGVEALTSTLASVRRPPTSG